MLMFLASSCVLILLLIALRPFMKKRVSPLVRYSLWLLVALRLLVPFQFGSSTFSLENLFRDEAPTAQVEVQTSPQTNIGAETPTYFDSVEIQRPQTVIPETLPFEQEESIGSPTLSPMQEVPTTDPMGSLIQEERRHLSPTVPQILNGIWFVGFLSMALWFLAVNIRFGKKAKVGATKVETTGIPIPVYETGSVPSPCMTGLIRPRIYLLPCKAPRQQAHILTHEYTHYRHLDHIWSLVRGLCLCVHWFNPLVWIAAYLSKEDCELACDHSAIQALGEEERIPYGRTLLDTLVQANRPGNLLRSATTMGGGKKQIRTRLEAIVSKPKKLLWALLCLILVVALSVGCTFTGRQEAAQDPTEEATETTEPTEAESSTETTATEETDTLDYTDPRFYLYEDSTYDCYASFPYVHCTYVNENYQIPKIRQFENSSYAQQVNEEISERFDNIARGDDSQFKSLSYRWNIATLLGVDCYDSDLTYYLYPYNTNFTASNVLLDMTLRVLILDITAVDHQGNTETISYYLDVYTGNALSGSEYDDDIRGRITRELIGDLYDEYANTGKISFTDEDRALYEDNLSKAVKNATVKVLSHNSVTFTIPYVTMNGSVQDLDMNPTPTESISVNSLYKPQVVDLYTYTANDGSRNTIPFVLLDNDSGIRLNETILQDYLYYLPSKLSYTAATHGDILSFSIQAEDPYIYSLICHAGNAFLDPNKTGIPEAEYVLSLSKNPMTYDEYRQKAKILLPSYFFDLFPGITEQFPNNELVFKQLSHCGSHSNITASTPYLDKDGNIWTLATIYQIAGTSETKHLIPISTGKINEEYLAFQEAFGTFSEPDEVLERYLDLLYGDGSYILSYDDSNTYPEYTDDKIYAQCHEDHISVRLSYNPGFLLSPQDIQNIPELRAATDLLGMINPVLSLEIGTSESDNRVLIQSDYASYIYNNNEPFIRIIEDRSAGECDILIYWKT